MKNRFLLPHRFIKIGIPLFIVGAVLGLLYMNSILLPIFKVHRPNSWDLGELIHRETYQGDIATTLLIFGLYFIGFSRRRSEDEYIDFLRYKSLLLAVVIQSAVLVVLSWIIGGIDFYYVMVLNLFSLLIIFNLIFLARLYLINRHTRS